MAKMAEKIRALQKEEVKKLLEKHEADVKSCFDEALKYAAAHPAATKCTFWYKKTSSGFKVALQEAAFSEGMWAEVGFFGRRVTIWFDNTEVEEECYVNEKA